MIPEEVFVRLLERCHQDVKCARAVQRLCVEYGLPEPEFEWREISKPEIMYCRQHPALSGKLMTEEEIKLMVRGLKDNKEF